MATHKNYFVLSFLIFVAFSFKSYSQISHGGQPRSLTDRKLPVLNVLSELPGKQALPSYLNDQTESKTGAYQFAWPFDVDFDTDNAGQWDKASDGSDIWRLAIYSESAYSLNLIFDQFILPPTGELFVYNEDYTVVLGSFTSENVNLAGGLAIAPVAGDQVIVEYIQPADAAYKGILHINKIGHDYKNAFGKKDGNYGRAGACNVDINCADGSNWVLEKRAVCRLVINGSTLCTGTLLNNTHQNRKPYMITANHCIDYQNDANNTVFVFNYESPTCGGVDGSVSQSMSGGKLIATKNTGGGFLDYSLLLLNDMVPDDYRPYFAGWDARGNTPEKSVCIHHPKGDVKKISTDNNQPANGVSYGFGFDPYTFIKILEWDKGTTEHGSSGAPLFDQNHHVIGTLTGGDAVCDSSVNDYFQMFSVAFDRYEADTLQLKHWLDPDNSGTTYLDGYKPIYANEYASNLVNIYHWTAQDSGAVYLVDAPGQFGYVSGNNSYGDKAKAEFFNKSEFGTRDVITGAYVWFAAAKGRPYQDVEFFLKPDDGFGSPSLTKTLAKSYLGMDEIIRNVQDEAISYFPFDPPIEISGHIYAGVTLPQYAGDTLAIVNSYYDPGTNSAWELGSDNQWYPYNLTWGNSEKNFSLLIGLVAGKFVSVSEQPDQTREMEIYPNPANEQVNVRSIHSGVNIQAVYVYNNLGQMVEILTEINQEKVVLNTQNWNEGIYYLQVVSENGVENKNLIIRK